MYYPFAGNAELFHGNYLVYRKLQSIVRKVAQQLLSAMRPMTDNRLTRLKQA